MTFFVGLVIGAAGATAAIIWAVGGFKNFYTVVTVRFKKAK
jgi:hypothetical protein